MASGSCNCGKVKFSITDIPHGATACHCLECREVFGAPYGSWLTVSDSSIVWSMKPDLSKKTKIAERGYCSICETPITMQYFLQPHRISLSLLTLDCVVPITDHIFLQEQEKGYVLPDDGAARHQRFDPPFEKKLQEWCKSSGPDP